LSILFACGIGAGGSAARAATAVESFDYAAGSKLIGQNGGSGWATAWGTVTSATTNSAIGSGSLTYPGVTSAGNKMISVATGNGDSRALRTLATSYSSGIVYFSTLAENLNDTLRYFGLALYNGSTEKVLLGQNSGYPNWTLSNVFTNGLAAGTLMSAVDSSALALLLLKVEFNASSVNPSYERLTFWVNPDLSQPESAATAVGGQAFSTSIDYGTINGVRIGAGNAAPAPLIYMDEVRVSTVSPFAPPALQIAVSNSAARLSWPATGWTLQKASNLVENSWTGVAGTEAITTTNLPVALPVEFFRLHQE
jgi:hypothetical protein